jgi:beta-1,3-galactosyltransferase / beta-1,3-N-acetylglucosaminyltransferase
MFPRNRLFVKLLIRYGSAFVFICFIANYFGLATHLFEESFRDQFSYPFDGNILNSCFAIRHGNPPEFQPINNVTFSYRNINKNKCMDEFAQSPLLPKLMIVVKSKIDHFDRRNAIRNSWGFEKRFSDVVIRTVFSLGIDKETHDGKDSAVQKLVDLEAQRYNDIIQVSTSCV